MSAPRQPFTPRRLSGQLLTATTTASTAALLDAQKINCQVRVNNKGANPIYFATGYSDMPLASASASGCDFEVAAGQSSTISKAQDHTHFSVISTTGSSAFSLIVGDGF